MIVAGYPHGTDWLAWPVGHLMIHIYNGKMAAFKGVLSHCDLLPVLFHTGDFFYQTDELALCGGILALNEVPVEGHSFRRG